MGCRDGGASRNQQLAADGSQGRDGSRRWSSRSVMGGARASRAASVATRAASVTATAAGAKAWVVRRRSGCRFSGRRVRTGSMWLGAGSEGWDGA